MKRFLSLIMVLIILVFSCVPVFGATVDSNYFNFTNLSLYDSSFVDFHSDTYTYINNNISHDIYIIPYRYYKNRSYKSFLFIAFPKDTSVSFVETDSSVTDSTYSSYTLTEFVFDGTFNSFLDYYYLNAHFGQSVTMTSPSTSQRFVNHKIFDSSNFLLFRDGNCVSEAFCSEDYYTGGNSGDDYVEGNVTITGLDGFFNSIKNFFKEQINEIKNLPSVINEKFTNTLKDLFIPDTEKMKTSFQEFIYTLTEKFGFNDLIQDLQNLIDYTNDDGYTNEAADISESFVLSLCNNKICDKDINLNFSVPFSDYFSSTVKDKVGDYMKGIFFILLLFYNLSEIYFLIRGTRPWKDPVIVSELNMIQNEKAVKHMRRRS